jgi:hypothetical protein
MEHPFPKKWSDDVAAMAKSATTAVNAERAFFFLPLIPLLAASYYLSKIAVIRFEYSIVPCAAWLASRYGRHGLTAFAIGGLTYWLGLSVSYFPTRFTLLPDFYIVGVVVAWAAADPNRFLQKLQSLRPSFLQTAAIVLILPTSIVIWQGSLQFGWKADLLFPFVLFLLGWAGVPGRRMVPLIVSVGLIGLLLGSSFLRNVYPLDYGLRDLGQILLAMLCYLAGLALNEVCFNTSGASVASSSGREGDDPVARAMVRWLRSTNGYIGLGIIMVAALAAFTLSITDMNISLWRRSFPLLMLGAFMAGFLWAGRGIHLAAAVTAILVVLCCLTTWSDGLTLDFGSFKAYFWLGGIYSNFFVLIWAPVYAVMGKQMAISVAAQTRVGRGSK